MRVGVEPVHRLDASERQKLVIELTEILEIVADLFGAGKGKRTESVGADRLVANGNAEFLPHGIAHLANRKRLRNDAHGFSDIRLAVREDSVGCLADVRGCLPG